MSDESVATTDAAARMATLGYVGHPRRSPATEPWQPLFSKTLPNGFAIAFVVAAPHTNSRGLVHGGVLAALADNAMGLACGVVGGNVGLLTVGLSIDYFGVARMGELIEVIVDVQKSGKSMSFATCTITADGRPCAGARATFRSQ